MLFLYACLMNIAQKFYNNVHLNHVLALILFFISCVYFSVVTSHKMFFSQISTSSLPCIERLFSKMKLLKTLLCTQLKQTNLEN